MLFHSKFIMLLDMTHATISIFFLYTSNSSQKAIFKLKQDGFVHNYFRQAEHKSCFEEKQFLYEITLFWTTTNDSIKI